MPGRKLAISPRSIAILIALNLLWSLHPIYGKILLSRVEPLQGAWLRYLASWLAWGCLFLFQWVGARAGSNVQGGGSFRLRVAGMGLLTFFLAPLLQMEGLARSHASDNAILVAMEPLFAVALAWIFLKERPARFQVPGFVGSCLGVFLISGGVNETGSAVSESLFLGNLMIVVSMLGEASYSVIGKSLAGRVDPLRGFGLAMGVGVMALGMVAIARGLPLLPTGTSPEFWLALLALGPLGTTGGYLAWWYLLRDVPVRLAALSLFIQPLAGALWGSWLMGDPWSAARIAGASLTLLGVLAVVLSELNKSGAPHLLQD